MNVARRMVRLQQQLDLGLGADRVGSHLDRLRLVRHTGDLGEREAAAATPSDRGGEVGCLEQAVLGEIFGIDIADCATVDDSKACAVIVAGIDPLDSTLFDADRLVAFALDKELNEVRPRA
ncbi:MAG: hypothetical protein PVSMB9_05130 [Candidatus Dormibacteria bacterium]